MAVFKNWLAGRGPTLDPPHPLIHGMVPLGTLVAIYGKPGCGKSTIACLLAAAISNTGRWLGTEVEKGVVVYIAPERGRHAERVICASAADISDTHPSRVAMITEPMLDLTTKQSIEDLDQTITQIEREHGKVRAIVVDTYGRATSAVEESDTPSQNRVLNPLAALATRHNLSIFLITHEPHHASRMKGSIAILAAADVAIRVAANKRGPRTAMVEKNNYGPTGHCIKFEIGDFTGEEIGIARLCGGPVAHHGAARSQEPKLNTYDKLAYETLVFMSADGAPIAVDAWRAASFDAFGDGAGSKNRQRWSRAKASLVDQGFVTLNGQVVTLNVTPNSSGD